MTQNLFGDFLLQRLLTDLREDDLFGRYRYPLRLEKVPQISQIYTDFSSDDTEFIRRFPAKAITHGFSRMRPVRSLQIPPETDKEIHQRFHKKSVYICEICGTKNFHEEKSASSAKSAWQTNSSSFGAPAIGQRPNIRENPWVIR